MRKIQRRPEPDLSLLPDTIAPILKRIYINRGIRSTDELETGAKALHSYKKLAGIDAAVQLLFNAIQEGKRIIIVGDFDVDGATSSALSLLAMRMLGSNNVDYFVPNRFEDGYGLSSKVVTQLINLGAEIIMTVDNGISSIDGVRYAKQLGLQVLVTDHHLPGSRLPEADVIVNPNLSSCNFPSKALSGVGVAFYLMMALCVYMRKANWFRTQGMLEPKLMELVDLVALGTIADVVPLDKNNRILVYQGLQRIRAGKARVGIQALIEISQCSAKCLVASDLAFSLGPRINAAGRLDDMSLGVELLISNSIHVARHIARKLNKLNDIRKEIEEDMQQDAEVLCDTLRFAQNKQLPYGLVLFQHNWHQGIIGILASRIKEKFQRPVIVFASCGKGMIKASCRSIAGFHMYDALSKMHAATPDLISKFGGHSMAAGLIIQEKDFKRFSKLFDQVVCKELDSRILKGIILSDGELKPEEFSMRTAELLRASGPWGQGFPEPTFDGKFKLLSQKLVGKRHLKVILEFLFKGCSTGVVANGIAFNVDLYCWPDVLVDTVHLAYKLDINKFRGKQSLQLLIEHIGVA
ncbi:single-stranded-DNA-specific exonuclease [Candidatus Photodesmus blepharus]|uniref:Single-stranded-DNA-specific exonuclease RecJ n=1 Tax=Candidatus Photodesmus blepharonis TaxID=1179155 RepID=A0A084CP38_9GAMM|nr:single-stranded-DNA-specific exonuclease RecJ [Candidatus Photodesmus blepharus]KEY91567.1 single-stranded-DNA-specific exonuclease [Candidatus Photodesmus blepharus]